ncbi:MAG: hypothetical protein U5L09_04450 [Bacteroidales bacterium]|nr:hypothetical protein [Bacteroidales bacterium]
MKSTTFGILKRIKDYNRKRISINNEPKQALMDNKNNMRIGMPTFGAIFFIFGFATTFIVTMTAPVKAIFGLPEWGAQLLSSAFFITLSHIIHSFREISGKNRIQVDSDFRTDFDGYR